MDREFQTVSVVAAADLSSFQFRAIQIDGLLATENLDAAGTLQNKPVSGQDATCAYAGIMRGVAGAAISAGVPLKVQSGGWLITATSGTGNVGKNLNAAVTSGSVFRFMGNFANAVDAFGA